MPDGLVAILAVAATVIAVGGMIGLADRRFVDWRWLLVAVGLILLNDALLTSFYGALPDVIGGERNWQGKLLALVASIAIASTAWFGWRASGLTLDQGDAPRRPTWIVVGFIAAAFLGLALAFPNEPIAGEELGFQLTMPGLEEELFYRGVLLLAFDRAFAGRKRFAGVEWGWGALFVTALFGMVHAFSYANGAFEFDAMAFALTALPSVLLFWIRARTGSLLWPTLLHNLANTAPMLV